MLDHADMDFDAAFALHAPTVFAFICARVGPDAAEDLTSEAFVVAFRARAKFDRSRGDERSWLLGCAVNVIRQHREQEARWLTNATRELSSVETDEFADADERLVAGARSKCLAAALAQLNAGERDVLVLHVLEGVPHDAIAVLLGIRPGSAKARLSRGRARLRAALESEEVHS